MDIAELAESFRVDWRGDAACIGVDPMIFFPERGKTTRKAKQICDGCPVKVECGEFAVTGDACSGVWGGMSETERREIRKKSREIA